ncbi:hypothetical protein [Ruegeria aquimaris]|uniref:Lipoprotein n=1 Tax=Ruegeria aquimaris TaxID=2984333 RepID=A0ABT3AFS2_9RHOB|nr:hypothetical protein [Ruegeria sp. XHP0148]MCV2887137.1 hypothetical protein [Ruegeria sp. XHP0148]
MVQNNKVLTVSYGTFSCTLEGFDDSFDTMKAIAEYFRDLAADDRYFGAEPPQPDAEMLARIAQREIARQVEARRDATGIVLRAADPVAAAVAPAAAVDPAPKAEVEAPAEPVVEEAAVAEAEVQPAPQAEATVEEAVTEAPAAQPDEAEAAAAVEDDAADILASVAAHVIDEDEPQDTATEEAEIAEWAEPETFETEPVEAEAFEAEPVEPTPPAADSIAAKLQRIRAVVSRNEQAAHIEEAFSEDEHADAVSAEATVSDAVADITAALEADADYDEIYDEDQDEAVTPAPVAPADEHDEDEAIVAEPVAAPAPSATIRVAKVRRAEIEQPKAPEQPQTTGTLSAEDEEDLLRELAAVEAEYFAEQDSDDEQDGDDRDSIFAETDEADDDARFEADDASIFGGNDEEELTAEVADEDDDTDEDDVSRLMARADEKLGDPELSSGRETYSQMRGAVAAAKAEKSAGGTFGTQTDDNAYRTDLAEVVRPRRPVATAQTPRSREEARPAPLKLVAEQRIDTPRAAATRGPVLPRRVASLVTEDTPAAAVEGSFADFVAETGASGLHELLEAAAAYMSFVENRDHFSRPQLMNKVRQLDDQEFNREDGLRSFGQLLREGKLKKTANGLFTASGQIGFRPDKRAAG